MDPQFHYHVYKCPPPVLILIQINPVHSSSHILEIHINIILPSTPESYKWFLSFRLPHQNPVYISPPPVRAKCQAHLILLDLITRMFGEE